MDAVDASLLDYRTFVLYNDYAFIRPSLMSDNLVINPHQLPFPVSPEGIRTSQKSNIFYSKVFTYLSEKTTAGGVELESNSARSAVSLRHGQGGYPFPIRKGDHTTSEVKPTKKSAESASISRAFFIYK